MAHYGGQPSPSRYERRDAIPHVVTRNHDLMLIYRD